MRRNGRHIYRVFAQGEILLTDAASAEMAKLVENAYRDVNIAFANELSQITEALHIDVWEVIRLANRHPRVNILSPGPGVGGHCIPVDPWFIVAAAPHLSPLIRTAREVNDRRPHHVAEQVIAKADSVSEPDDRLPRADLQGQCRRHPRKPGHRGGRPDRPGACPTSRS